MANEVLFAGGRLDSLRATGAPTEQTTANTYYTAYSDCAVRLLSTDLVIADFYTVASGVLSPTTVVSAETCWVHFVWGATATAAFERTDPSLNLIELRDSSGFPWLAIRTDATNRQFGLYYNSGSGASPTWTLLGSTWIMPTVPASPTQVDIMLTLGSPHSVQLSLRNSQVYSGTFTQASLTNLASAAFRGTVSVASYYITFLSQILCTRGISTIGSLVKTMRPTGAGANTAWAGAYTDVNEVVGSDATVNSSGTAAQKQSYAMTDVTVPTGFVVKGLFHWMRGKNDGAAPTNIKSLLRSGGVDYSSANVYGIGLSYGPIGLFYATDPATSAAWIQAGLDALEVGYESAA